jgi:hypothetical protein
VERYMNNSKQIIAVELEKLLPHSANPNRMARSSFNKLKEHIRATGNYEPIIVRVHPEIEGSYQMLNGHHRVKVLGELGSKLADCVVWDVDDEGALVLLATLNRLTGSDELERKSELVKSLSKRLNVKQLVKMLPESSKSIERLKSLSCVTKINTSTTEQMLSPVVFFLDDKQNKIFEEALAKAEDGVSGTTRAVKKAVAMAKICETYLRCKV